MQGARVRSLLEKSSAESEDHGILQGALQVLYLYVACVDHCEAAGYRFDEMFLQTEYRQ